jgi:hypothetical protein
MSRLEMAGAVVIVAAVLIVVGFLSWSLLRPSKVPARVGAQLIEWKDAPPGDWDDHSQLDAYAVAMARFGPGIAIPVDGDPRSISFSIQRYVEPGRAFVWPQRGSYEASDGHPEPVRESFRRFLSGGPDYCRGDR